MMLSDTLYQSERQVYTLFTLIGDVGGFNAAVIILPAYLLSIYSDKMYKASIQKEIPVRSANKPVLDAQGVAASDRLLHP